VKEVEKFMKCSELEKANKLTNVYLQGKVSDTLKNLALRNAEWKF